MDGDTLRKHRPIAKLLDAAGLDLDAARRLLLSTGAPAANRGRCLRAILGALGFVRWNDSPHMRRRSGTA